MFCVVSYKEKLNAHSIIQYSSTRLRMVGTCLVIRLRIAHQACFPHCTNVESHHGAPPPPPREGQPASPCSLGKDCKRKDTLVANHKCNRCGDPLHRTCGKEILDDGARNGGNLECPEGYGCNQSKRPSTDESFKSKSVSVSGNDIAVVTAIASNKGIVSSGNPTASSRTNLFACTKPTAETTAARRLIYGNGTLDCRVPIIPAEAGAEPRCHDEKQERQRSNPEFDGLIRKEKGHCSGDSPAIVESHHIGHCFHGYPPARSVERTFPQYAAEVCRRWFSGSQARLWNRFREG